MVELEVKLGSKTGLDTVQNEKHVEVEVAPPDDSNQAPLVRVTPPHPDKYIWAISRQPRRLKFGMEA